MRLLGLLIVLPLIIWFGVSTLKHLYKYLTTKKKEHLLNLIKLWGIVVTITTTLMFVRWQFSNTIDKDRVVGCYGVDTSFYLGNNSNWQKEHYRFEITDDNEFILYERLADKSERKFLNLVSWSNGDSYPIKWSINIQEPHHVIDKHPTLYRGDGRFYYVFNTKRFGNMFFRKVKSKWLTNSCI